MVSRSETITLRSGLSLIIKSFGVRGILEPVIVLHAVGFDHSYYLDSGVTDLQSSIQVILYDQRAHGSTLNQPNATLSHEQWLEDLSEIRCALGINKFTLLGHSYGGYLALEYALKFPQHLSKLILVSTAAARAKASEVPKQLSKQEWSETIDIAWPNFFNDLAIARRTRRSLSLSVDGANAVSVPEALNFDLSDELKNIATPTLVIGGENDSPFLAGMYELARDLPDASLSLIPNCSHFPFIENRKLFKEAVLNFLVK